MIVVVFVAVVMVVVVVLPFWVSLHRGLQYFGILTLMGLMPLNVNVDRKRHRAWILFPGKVGKVPGLGRATRLTLVHASVPCTILDHNLDLALGQGLDIVAGEVIVQEEGENDAFKDTQPRLSPHPHDHTHVQNS